MLEHRTTTRKGRKKTAYSKDCRSIHHLIRGCHDNNKKKERRRRRAADDTTISEPREGGGRLTQRR